MGYQSKRAVYQVTEFKDGCVYKTQRLEDEWVDINVEVHPEHPHKLYGTAEKFEVRRVE